MKRLSEDECTNVPMSQGHYFICKKHADAICLTTNLAVHVWWHAIRSETYVFLHFYKVLWGVLGSSWCLKYFRGHVQSPVAAGCLWTYAKFAHEVKIFLTPLCL